jgi:type 1 fimbriae regulatory protein FimB/type 1 fimbriae regulatory protein FimE
MGAGITPHHWFTELPAKDQSTLVQACLDALDNRTIDPREVWLQVLFAVADAEQLGCSNARQLALDWSRRGRSWTSERDFDAAWNSFKPGGISHGLRAQEFCQLRWSQVDLRHGRLHVNRAKGGIESVHPLCGPELRALRPLQGSSPYVFVTEGGTPVTTAWFLRMVQRTGKAAKMPFAIHLHMLRHSTGYKLANDGHDTRSLAHYLGHRNLQSTARYTALAPDRFAGFWKD